MADKSDLQFMDSGQDDVLFDKADSQTHTFTNFPTSAVDDDDEEEADKSKLLKEDQKSPSFWTFEYYQQFFDVETHQVFHRVVGSMVPLPNRNYLQTHIRPTPDLYGPFWICTTLVFTTAIAGNLANYLSSGGKDYQWKYDFHKVTFAATAIFSYWWLVPAVLYGTLFWRKSQAGYTFLEILCLYGYSLAIYIPISILWVINFTWLRWTLVIIGTLLSGGVLVISVWPSVKDDTRKVAVIIIALVFIFHLALATGFVLYFFHSPASTAPAPVPGSTTPVPKPSVPSTAQNLATKAPTKNTEDKPADTGKTKGTGGTSEKGAKADSDTKTGEGNKGDAETDLSNLKTQKTDKGDKAPTQSDTATGGNKQKMLKRSQRLNDVSKSV